MRYLYKTLTVCSNQSAQIGLARNKGLWQHNVLCCLPAFYVSNVNARKTTTIENVLILSTGFSDLSAI